MSLLSTISSANRVIDQGNTFGFTTEPVYRMARIIAVDEGSQYTAGSIILVSQFRTTAHFVKRYRYVGLTKSAAETKAVNVADAYVVNMNRYVIGQYHDALNGITIEKYIPVSTGAVPTCCAAVSPTHEDGSLWNIEVDVDATVEVYADSAPSVATVRSLFSGISNFPEL